jgi:hypothetical protein
VDALIDPPLIHNAGGRFSVNRLLDTTNVLTKEEWEKELTRLASDVFGEPSPKRRKICSEKGHPLSEKGRRTSKSDSDN